ncbi:MULTISPECIES: hypothetical protein [Sedimenticola]|uniref:EF-hand domain-containing protein n=1 Tax=Sedimenticola selenatireducens TaxID=191960 RepID=A0A2N6D156_9GAMM|nr:MULTISPECIES: hypothetical protein [Sedimenticola]MCW8902135.1 hypothetical protein [Sedimenticola sp.]PLX63431.1 MAG: hypothetical protein C0630_00520 [Sedimenticola selenatireducens]
MKTSTLVKLLGFSVITMLSAATYAADMNTVQFESLDQNQDGQLTAEEAARDATVSENWTTIDKDANGAIDQAEFSAFESMMDKGDKPASE